MFIDNDDKYKLGVKLYAVYQLSKGKSSRELEDLYNTSFRQICNWADRFGKDGIGGLMNKPCSGRPTNLTSDQLIELRESLLKSPETYGYNTGSWSGPVVRDFVETRFQVIYKQANVYNLMQSLDFSCQPTKGKYSETRSNQERNG
ncbi:MAG: hypothetical protein QM751_07985 [Paludibacteraceae bacterium]